MREQTLESTDYGNWVSTRLLYGSMALSALFLGLSFVHPGSTLGAILFLSSLVYFAYARAKFSPRGGNLQAQIRGLPLDHLDWDGEGQALDIGCGNGPLAIALAKRYPNAHVTGIDYWGGVWEYSKGACERNAEAEGVAGRMTFQKASAAALPFEDGAFDAAVSNLVFHSVMDVRDKRAVVKEALRVVKEGGRFAFQDQFLDKGLYGEIDDLLETIKSWGIARVTFVNTSSLDLIPKALKLRFMVGKMGLIYGRK
jgi:SAM-dependent methyltransferase